MVVGSQGEGRKADGTADGKIGNEGYERRDGGGNLFFRGHTKIPTIELSHLVTHLSRRQNFNKNCQDSENHQTPFVL